MILYTDFRVKETTVGDASVVIVEGVKQFDVDKTFDCGQCFRFDRVENSRHEKEFSGVAFGKFVSFAQDGDTLYIYGSNLDDYENIWKRYLDIERDYSLIDSDILSCVDSEIMSKAVEHGNGIRILAQDSFECTVSFIISQNNNIPRIKKIIEALSSACGEPLELGEEMKKHLSGKSSLCAFPSVEAIYELSEKGLYDLKTGFRAKYIYDAVSRIKDKRLCFEKIAEEDTENAIKLLCEVKGIGPKVASCILLFSFLKLDAFPIDVWIKKVAEKYFSHLEEFSAESFGRYAGIAQQYLFFYERYISL